jgi:hypothetical protein
MRNYLVTLVLITGYEPDDCSLDFPEAKPITTRAEFHVMAESEEAAIAEAKRQDHSKLSVWEGFADVDEEEVDSAIDALESRNEKAIYSAYGDNC